MAAFRRPTGQSPERSREGPRTRSRVFFRRATVSLQPPRVGQIQLTKTLQSVRTLCSGLYLSLLLRAGPRSNQPAGSSVTPEASVQRDHNTRAAGAEPAGTPVREAVT